MRPDLRWRGRQSAAAEPTGRDSRPIALAKSQLCARATSGGRRLIAFTVVAALLFVCTYTVSAAEKSKIKPYALIFGTVWDPQNRAVPGVKVRIQRVGDKHPKWELFSDARGEFAQRFPAGQADYLVWAEVKGKKGHLGETKVHIDNDERQDIGLHLPE